MLAGDPQKHPKTYLKRCKTRVHDHLWLLVYPAILAWGLQKHCKTRLFCLFGCIRSWTPRPCWQGILRNCKTRLKCCRTGVHDHLWLLVYPAILAWGLQKHNIIYIYIYIYICIYVWILIRGTPATKGFKSVVKQVLLRSWGPERVQPALHGIFRNYKNTNVLHLEA